MPPQVLCRRPRGNGYRCWCHPCLCTHAGVYRQPWRQPHNVAARRGQVAIQHGSGGPLSTILFQSLYRFCCRQRLPRCIGSWRVSLFFASAAHQSGSADRPPRAIDCPRSLNFRFHLSPQPVPCSEPWPCPRCIEPADPSCVMSNRPSEAGGGGSCAEIPV